MKGGKFTGKDALHVAFHHHQAGRNVHLVRCGAYQYVHQHHQKPFSFFILVEPQIRNVLMKLLHCDTPE
ncbi:hypothetical protein CS542_06310 [Pedobacter sp. IW39]|nr:hypothetical protein CS542_06310 [Pedobacter sp. IW39]